MFRVLVPSVWLSVLWFAGTESFPVLHQACLKERVRTLRQAQRSRLFGIIEISGSCEMEDFTQSNDLAVVCFHAHWCKACQRFQQQYRKLDVSNPLGVRLASIEYSKNTALSKSLGVKKLPTVQFFHRGQLLDSFSCGPKAFPRVLGTIQCLLGEIETQAVSKNLEEGAALLQSELKKYHLTQEFTSPSPPNSSFFHKALDNYFSLNEGFV